MAKPIPWTIADFTVGQRVQVAAYGAARDGTVTKVGRTRICVNHVKNKRGQRHERWFHLCDVLHHFEPDSISGGQTFVAVTGERGRHWVR